MTDKASPPVFAGREEKLAITLLLLLSLIVWFYGLKDSSAPGEASTRWRITVFSEPRQQSEMSCPAEKRLIVTGKLGPAEIEWDEHGRVRIASSTCPCRTCVNMGWSANAALICVPNGIMIEPLAAGIPSVDAVTR